MATGFKNLKRFQHADKTENKKPKKKITRGNKKVGKTSKDMEKTHNFLLQELITTAFKKL
jgi:hypothetical protein